MTAMRRWIFLLGALFAFVPPLAAYTVSNVNTNSSSYHLGDSVQITWSSDAPSGTTMTVGIINTSNSSQKVSVDTPNDGSQSVNIPTSFSLGTYRAVVICKADGSNGQSGDFSVLCTITECLVRADDGGTVGQAASFECYSYTGSCDTVDLIWDFGDGTSTHGWSPTHTYSTPGYKDWNMTMTSVGPGDVCGKSGTIYIAAPCTLSCSASAPSSGKVGDGIRFNASANTSGCTGSPTYRWDFGDGNNYTGGNGNTQWWYSQAGTYNWTLTVSVSGTSDCTKTGRIVITGSSDCTVTCSALAPSTASTGDNVQFQATSTRSDGCNDPAFYQWFFGDGKSSDDQNTTHSYKSAGVYYWTMEVRVGPSVKCSKTGTITVGGGGGGCTVNCSATVPGSGAVGSGTHFTGGATVSGCNGKPSYLWGFGDGATSIAQSPVHTYAVAGSYTWTLSARAAGATSCEKSGRIVIGGSGGGNSLSGKVIQASGLPAKGFAMKITGPKTMTKQTAADGSYSFTSLPNGTYTIASASKSYLCTPPSRTVAIAGASVSGQNFKVSNRTIAGTVTNVTGSGAAGVRLSLNGPITQSVTTDSTGRYQFGTLKSLPTGTYRITPSGDGHEYDPASRVVNLTGSSAKGMNFHRTTAIGTPNYSFSDDFKDGDASDWNVSKDGWTSTNRGLAGTFDRPALALAPHSGCVTCTIDAVVGEIEGSVSIVGWYQSETDCVELRLDVASDRVIFRQVVAGALVRREERPLEFIEGAEYEVRIGYDGTAFDVGFDDEPLMRVPAVQTQSGTAGLRIGSAEDEYGSGRLAAITIY